jgi:hypothetical protein
MAISQTFVPNIPFSTAPFNFQLNTRADSQRYSLFFHWPEIMTKRIANFSAPEPKVFRSNLRFSTARLQ